MVSESAKAMITQMLDLDEHRRSTAAALLKVWFRLCSFVREWQGMGWAGLGWVSCTEA